MSDKIKWSIAGVLVMLVLNSEVVSWIILAVIAYAWAWPFVVEVVTHD